MKRYGQVLKVRPEKLAEYIKLHENAWPGVIKMIKECNISNYSIYEKDGYLFSYYEYNGEDYEADMNKMKNDKVTLDWWKLTEPCQEPLETRKPGEWWAVMEEVFHVE